MNESAIGQSAAASTLKDRETRVRMGGRCIALCAALVFANLPAIALAQSCTGIHLKILNIRNSTGAVACALF
jgi:hypothetical protein